jgi:hypothetical protein
MWGSCTLFEQFAYEKVAIAHIMGMRDFAYLASISPAMDFLLPPLLKSSNDPSRASAADRSGGFGLPVDVTDGAALPPRLGRANPSDRETLPPPSRQN